MFFHIKKEEVDSISPIVSLLKENNIELDDDPTMIYIRYQNKEKFFNIIESHINSLDLSNNTILNFIISTIIESKDIDFANSVLSKFDFIPIEIFYKTLSSINFPLFLTKEGNYFNNKLFIELIYKKTTKVTKKSIIKQYNAFKKSYFFIDEKNFRELLFINKVYSKKTNLSDMYYIKENSYIYISDFIKYYSFALSYFEKYSQNQLKEHIHFLENNFESIYDKMISKTWNRNISYKNFKLSHPKIQETLLKYQQLKKTNLIEYKYLEEFFEKDFSLSSKSIKFCKKTMNCLLNVSKENIKELSATPTLLDEVIYIIDFLNKYPNPNYKEISYFNVIDKLKKIYLLVKKDPSNKYHSSFKPLFDHLIYKKEIIDNDLFNYLILKIYMKNDKNQFPLSCIKIQNKKDQELIFKYINKKLGISIDDFVFLSTKEIICNFEKKNHCSKKNDFKSRLELFCNLAKKKLQEDKIFKEILIFRYNKLFESQKLYDFYFNISKEYLYHIYENISTEQKLSFLSYTWFQIKNKDTLEFLIKNFNDLNKPQKNKLKSTILNNQRTLLDKPLIPLLFNNNDVLETSLLESNNIWTFNILENVSKLKPTNLYLYKELSKKTISNYISHQQNSTKKIIYKNIICDITNSIKLTSLNLFYIFNQFKDINFKNRFLLKILHYKKNNHIFYPYFKIDFDLLKKLNITEKTMTELVELNEDFKINHLIDIFNSATDSLKNQLISTLTKREMLKYSLKPKKIKSVENFHSLMMNLKSRLEEDPTIPLDVDSKFYAIDGFQTVDKEITFSIPKNVGELKQFSYEMKNCVHGYTKNILNSNQVIINVFRQKQPFVNICIYQNKILEIKYKENKVLSNEDLLFFSDILKKSNLIT